MRVILLLGIVLGAGAASVDGQDEHGWQRAVEPRDWEFPRDHGQHPDYRTEWWYFTGNLRTPEGRPFGFQFTIFRYGIQVVPAQAGSKWALRDVWFGHFTVTDVEGGEFRVAERVDRGALGMSGASTEGFEVWLDNRAWEVRTVGEAPRGGRLEPVLHLRATEPGFALDLTLTPAKPAVFHGPRHDGLSQKSAAPGNASHYYSYSRLEAKGTLRLDDRPPFAVAGTSWFDHEFSTSALGKDQAGWDWFCIQLGDGSELMLYAMRRMDGSVDPLSKGSLVMADGGKRHLRAGDFEIRPRGRWKSPQSGAVYPSGWEVRVPGAGLALQVEPMLRGQELFLHRLSELAYWEGACSITGTVRGQPVQGVGYTELSGYHRPLGEGMK